MLTGPKYVLRLSCNGPVTSTSILPVETPDVFIGITARISALVGAFNK
jgi:hypothetical protein